MPVLPIFSGKNFKLWAIKMEGLIGSVNLWKFFQGISINANDKSKGAIALFLIISALDENILSSIFMNLVKYVMQKYFGIFLK